VQVLRDLWIFYNALGVDMCTLGWIPGLKILEREIIAFLHTAKNKLEYFICAIPQFIDCPEIE
jgi:hypothetical protein